MTVVATVNAGKLTGEGRGVISELEWRSTTSLESAPFPLVVNVGNLAKGDTKSVK